MSSTAFSKPPANSKIQTIRRILSFFALSALLALTAAQEAELSLKRIDAVDSSRINKDQWRIKGYLNEPSGDITQTIGQSGLVAELLDEAYETLDTAAFAPNDCRILARGKRVVCKTLGSRLTLRQSKPPKSFHVASHGRANGFYRISGNFRRVNFQEDTVVSPLTVELMMTEELMFSDTNTDCSIKSRRMNTKTTIKCKPGTPVPTIAPTAASF